VEFRAGRTPGGWHYHDDYPI